MRLHAHIDPTYIHVVDDGVTDLFWELPRGGGGGGGEHKVMSEHVVTKTYLI